MNLSIARDLRQAGVGGQETFGVEDSRSLLILLLSHCRSPLPEPHSVPEVNGRSGGGLPDTGTSPRKGGLLGTGMVLGHTHVRTKGGSDLATRSNRRIEEGLGVAMALAEKC